MFPVSILFLSVGHGFGFAKGSFVKGFFVTEVFICFFSVIIHCLVFLNLTFFSKLPVSQ